MKLLEVKVPDVGVEGDVEVIEVCISKGDILELDSPLIVLESDKATVEVPSPSAGVVNSILVKVGDKVSEGSLVLLLEPKTESNANNEGVKESVSQETSATSRIEADEISPILIDKKSAEEPSGAQGNEQLQNVLVPDLGGSEQVEVIEVLAQLNQKLEQDDTLIVLESDKATMEIPSPFAGELKTLLVHVGDKLSEGNVIGSVLTSGSVSLSEPGEAPVQSDLSATSPKVLGGQADTTQAQPIQASTVQSLGIELDDSESVHAGPAVRKLARELSVDINRVKSTGPKNRILKDDLNSYIKAQVQIAQKTGGNGSFNALPTVRLPDFTAFGAIETLSMNKIQRLTAENMQASWLTVPHVTQFDEADITEMESFRKQQKKAAELKGVKLTPMAFLLKACAYALRQLPQFNVSLDMSRQKIIQKKYVHIGMAVDTPNGLVVPVIRNVDQKSLWQLAEECQYLALRARDRKLTPSEMQGGCFTISSLGGLGGTAFTPIVNTPEVAILGVSKSQYKPVFNGIDGFTPKLMLPLSLSYDHRAVNGADAARFTSLLCRVLSDLRELLL